MTQNHCKGGNAWTAMDNDFDQHLIIDLGQVMNVTRIWTQGRKHSSEYVMEYRISYGTNGLDYADYKESGGNIRVRQTINHKHQLAFNCFIFVYCVLLKF